MSRYDAFFIGFLLASLVLAGWLFFAAMDYLDAGFNCADRTSNWKACEGAIQTPIAIKAACLVTIWSVGLWLLIRERKKQ